MSQSTIIVIETGLDKYEIYCGSRGPAVAARVPLNESLIFRDEAALLILSRMPNAGAGRRKLFDAIMQEATENKQYQYGDASWLTVTISRHD